MDVSGKSISNILLIADGSQSAVPFWQQVTRTIAELLENLRGSVNRIALLGTQVSWHPSEWRAEMKLPVEAQNSGSFLAPVMTGLRTQGEKSQAVILVGAGQIFDLLDWTAIFGEVVWGLVCVGGESLQATFGRLLEVSPQDLSQLYQAVNNSVQTTHTFSRPGSSGIVKNYRWQLDRSGYPMVYIEPAKAFFHLFPLTKPQFEHFLAESRLPGYGDAWYSGLLANLTPRLSPCLPVPAEYEQLFITGLLPEDVLTYLDWHGEGMRLPTVGEWQTAWRWLADQEATVPSYELERDLAATARHLWSGLLLRLQPTSLLDLSLMRGGLIEWVQEPEGNWMGMGKPRKAHPFHDPLRDPPLQPAGDLRRSRWFGLRLVTSA